MKSREQELNEKYANGEKKRIENKEFMIIGEEFAYDKGISEERANTDRMKMSWIKVGENQGKEIERARWEKKIEVMQPHVEDGVSCFYASQIYKLLGDA